MYIKRNIASVLKKQLDKFPIVTLTGPRQSGKTTLLKEEFPEYKYYNLERIDHREMILSDPLGFLNSVGDKIILDEIQRVPELFSYIQVISDERGMPGQYILSGSQSFLMNKGISQSLAGRTYISHLFPFDATELEVKTDLSETLFNGAYPRLHDAKISATDFYPSYIQTYIERDIRSLKAIENLNSFIRFVSLCAGRIGQILNLTSLANDTGISVNTAKSWLSLLESSFIIFQLQPYYKNFNKRLIKSPKLYFYDTGLVCSLLKLQNAEMVKTHYLYGVLYENYIISEIVKVKYHSGIIPLVFYWRESNGNEIDCIIEESNTELTVLEIKAGETFSKDFLKNLKRFPETSCVINKKLIYNGDSSIISDIQLIGQNKFLSFLNTIR